MSHEVGLYYNLNWWQFCDPNHKKYYDDELVLVMTDGITADNNWMLVTL